VRNDRRVAYTGPLRMVVSSGSSSDRGLPRSRVRRMASRILWKNRCRMDKRFPVLDIILACINSETQKEDKNEVVPLS